MPPRPETYGHPRSRSPGSGRAVLTDAHPVREALRARRRVLHRLWVGEGPESAELRALAEAAGVPITVEAPTGSAAQAVPRLEAGSLPELTVEALASRDNEAQRTLVALDGVEDPQNLGAIARVAEAAGVAGLLLTQRRAPPLSPAVSRASAGAIEWLPVARVPNLRRAIAWLKTEGFWALGADPEGGDSIDDPSGRWREGNHLLVLGAEGRGIRQGIAQELDHRVKIPMMGRVASLNVATAAAVLLFELGRSRRLGRESQLRREYAD